MANPLNNEQALYDQIKNEKITVPLVIWDLMYRYLGDEISAMTQITLSYWRCNEPIPVSDAGKLLDHSKKINTVIRKIIYHDEIKDENEKIGELRNINTKLHPILNELFFHYIGNDLYGIDLIVASYIDESDPQPVPVEMARKILNKTASMKLFMDRLREATNQEVRI